MVIGKSLLSGKTLRKIRKNKGVTQLQLSFKVPVTRESISKYENEVVMISDDLAVLLLNALGVHVENYKKIKGDLNDRTEKRAS